MTMGPEPTIRMRWRSLRRGIRYPIPSLDHLHEIVEQIVRIVRAGRGLGMVLHAEHRMIAMAEAFQRLVVQIDVGELDLVQVERIGIHREAVIVRRDLHLVGELVQHRVIGAAMAELQLVGLAAKREAENLMAQADAENRLACRSACAPVRPGTASGSGSPGPFERKTPSGLSASTSSAEVPRGNHRDAAAHLHQPPQNVALDAVIVGHHVAARLGGRRDAVRMASRRPPACPTRSCAAWTRAWPDRGRPWTAIAARARPASCAIAAAGRKHAAHHAARAQMAHQRAGVDFGDHGNAVARRETARAVSSERQLLASGENSRTTRPSMYGRADFVDRRRWRRSCRFADWSGPRSGRSRTDR